MWKVCVLGASGLVGTKMRQILEERNFPVSEFIPVASERSWGSELEFNGNKYEVISPQAALEMKPDIALFSAGGGASKEWAPRFAEKGCTVIDNSSAWRMDPEVPLVVPEVNASSCSRQDKLIANPNCSTIQMVVALAPLHRHYGIKRLVISTYQSVTGTGYRALRQLEAERSGADAEKVYPHQIDWNCLPHCDIFLDNDYTREEMKMVNETRKILGDENMHITATAVRVPVRGGHSESVNVTLNTKFDIEEIREMLNTSPGITLMDEPGKNRYPMPLIAEGRDDVFVGRLRKDDSWPNSLNLWIVSDNLRKGAATNAIQIAEHLFD